MLFLVVVTDYQGTYEEYVHHSGDDHLDADTVILKARREKRAKKKDSREVPAAVVPLDSAGIEKRRKKLERRRDELTRSIETAELRIAEIDETFCTDQFYENTPAERISGLEKERDVLQGRVEREMETWSTVESEIEQLGSASR